MKKHISCRLLLEHIFVQILIIMFYYINIWGVRRAMPMDASSEDDLRQWKSPNLALCPCGKQHWTSAKERSASPVLERVDISKMLCLNKFARNTFLRGGWSVPKWKGFRGDGGASSTLVVVSWSDTCGCLNSERLNTACCCWYRVLAKRNLVHVLEQAADLGKDPYPPDGYPVLCQSELFFVVRVREAEPSRRTRAESASRALRQSDLCPDSAVLTAILVPVLLADSGSTSFESHCLWLLA